MVVTDYSHEIAFWKVTLAAESVPELDRTLRAGFFPDQVIPCLYELREDRGGRPRLLDLGAGPLSQLAWAVDEDLAQVAAVDPLAEEYAAIMARYGHEFPIAPVKGRGEELLEVCETESFDLVYCGNALDHVVSPAACLANMCAVLRPRGFLVVVSALREGTHQQWHGLHQHDLVPEDGTLQRYDKRGKRESLTEGLGLRCIFQFQEGKHPGDQFILVFKKPEPGGGETEPENRYSELIACWLKKHTQSDLARTNPSHRERDFPEILLDLHRAGWRRGRSEAPLALEVGSGPLSRLAFGVEQQLLQLTAVDPMAEVYADLLERRGYSYPVKPDRCAAEDLASRFSAESFDLVYAGDALEYCAVPSSAMAAMKRVLKPRGVLALEGALEARSRHGGPGGQLHDLMLLENGLCVRDPEGLTRSLTKDAGLAVLRCEQAGDAQGDRYALLLQRG